MGKLTAREARIWAYWTTPQEPAGSVFHDYAPIDFLREGVAEHEAEHLSETALFGDSGPGMGYRLNKMEHDLRRVERILAKIKEKMAPPAMPSVASPAVIDDDDIPF